MSLLCSFDNLDPNSNVKIFDFKTIKINEHFYKFLRG